MGRASRMKAESRVQRAPRTVSIYNPNTGQIEQHQVTISDRGLANWVRDRERLAAQGYQDRPPDYDDETVRGWNVAPGESALIVPSEWPDDQFAQSWTTHHPILGWDLRMSAFAKPDGGFVVRYEAETAYGRVLAVDHHFGVWADVLEFTKDQSHVWVSIGCPEPTLLSRRGVDRLIERDDLNSPDDTTAAA
jgi:hypothetical protein